MKSATQPIISLHHIFFQYRTEEILEDINLDISPGDFVGIIGPNGGGKTTLLKIVLGLLQPTKGFVHLYGQSLSAFHDWTKIGYVSQRASQLNVHLPITVEEVVSLGRVAKRGLFQPLNSTDRQAIQQALERVEMTEYRRHLITELSGGQQQRVLIARALAADPDVLILDETTAGVDSESQEQFYQLLTKLNKKGLTLLIVSHDIDVILNEVNQVACINKRLVFEGSPEKFVAGKYLEKMYGKSRKFLIHGH
jgi:zinc transport system ATP-binding protein